MKMNSSNSRVIFDDLGHRDYKETWDYQERFFNAKVGEEALLLTVGKYRTALIFVEHNHV